MIDTKEGLIVVHVMQNYDQQRGGIFNVVHNLLSHTVPNISQYVLANKGPKSVKSSHVLHSPEELKAIGVDIIHLHGMGGFHGRVLRYLKKNKTSACLIHSPHGHWHPYVQKERPFYKRCLANILYEQILFEQCANYFVLTQEEIDHLKRRSAGGQFEIVQNGLDQDLLMLSKQYFGEEVSSFQERENTLLFIGEISPRKGVMELVSAFRKVAPDHWQLNIYGPTPARYESYQAGLKDLVSGDSRVSLNEPISGEQKYKKMLSAKIFCLPSFAEGMALAPLEAATLGCKLLVSEACGYETLPQGTIFHTYDQHQETALERTMEQMLTQPDSFFEPDLETIRQMQTSYEWETIINHYFRLYESCHQ